MLAARTLTNPETGALSVQTSWPYSSCFPGSLASVVTAAESMRLPSRIPPTIFIGEFFRSLRKSAIILAAPTSSLYATEVRMLPSMLLMSTLSPASLSARSRSDFLATNDLTPASRPLARSESASSIVYPPTTVNTADFILRNWSAIPVITSCFCARVFGIAIMFTR